MTTRKSKQEIQVEFDAQREVRINETIKNLRIQILTMETQKKELFKKVLEARQHNLQNQEEQARSIMRKCMAIQHQARGMLMTLELAIQSKDLAKISRQFLECIGMMASDVVAAVGKMKSKSTEKKYLQAMYESKQYIDKIDHMLELGDYVSIAASENSQYMEYNAEIDEMLMRVESGLV